MFLKITSFILNKKLSLIIKIMFTNNLQNFVSICANVYKIKTWRILTKQKTYKLPDSYKIHFIANSISS